VLQYENSHLQPRATHERHGAGMRAWQSSDRFGSGLIPERPSSGIWQLARVTVRWESLGGVSHARHRRSHESSLPARILRRRNAR
jgi:hypothetical protein